MANMIKDTLANVWTDQNTAVALWDMEDYNTDTPTHSALSSYSAITVDSSACVAKKPSRYDIPRLKRDLEADAADHTRTIHVVHGLYALYDKLLRDMALIKVFMTSDPDTRLVRWIRRDVVDGGAPLESVIFSYLKGARQEMQEFIFPTKEMADIIMPRGAEQNGAGLIVDGIVAHLSLRPLDRLFAGGATLRPSSTNVFGGEVLDNQKATFYDLT